MNDLPSPLRMPSSFKFYVWTDRYSYLAVAHADSVSSARDMLLIEIGTSDGSSPERDKARKCVEHTNPTIWVGPVCKFAITDSAALEEEQRLGSILRKQLAAVLTEQYTLSSTVEQLQQENLRLRNSIRNQLADNQCHLLHPDTDPIPPAPEMEESCRRFITQRRGECNATLTGCMTIAQLETRIVELEAELSQLNSTRREPECNS